MYNEYPVWWAAAGFADCVGASRAFAPDTYVSRGAPVALRVASDILFAEPALGGVLAGDASRESYLLDYANHRSRFMFGFGDGRGNLAHRWTWPVPGAGAHTRSPTLAPFSVV